MRPVLASSCAHVALLACLAAAAPLGAQGAPRPDPERFTFGAAGGAMAGAPHAFSASACPRSHGSSVAVNAGVRLAPRLLLQGSVARQRLPEEWCLTGPQQPIPPTGFFVRSYAEHPERLAGNPFTSTALRLAVEPLVERYGRLRFFAGYATVRAKRFGTPLAGGEWVIGSGFMRGRLEVEHWRYTLPLDLTDEHYQDRVLTSRTVRTVEVRENTTFVRLGLELAPRR
jgi:hypothetical protein